jgi:predicted transcriptional regulator
MVAVKVQLPTKRGKVTLLVDRSDLKVIKGGVELRKITDNQARILRKLAEAPEGMVAAELSKGLGMTRVGAIFLLKPLIQAKLVERVATKGESILYYAPIAVGTKRSSNLESIKKEVEEAVKKQIREMGARELYQTLRAYPQGVKNAILNWLLDGGWIG